MTWQYLLKHIGHWRGSFTRLSAQGEVKEDIPTLVTLEGVDDNQKIHQVVQHFDPESQAVTYEKVLDYDSLSRSTLIFDTGAFSQGSMQYSPVAEFGAEFGFVHGDRRLRIVEMYESGGALNTITLIREHRDGTDAPARSHLTVEQLLGEWRGELITLYPDMRSPTTSTSNLKLEQHGDTLEQYMDTPGFDFRSTATIQDKVLRFEQGDPPNQVLLLPDGASCTCPTQIQAGRPFFLEAGWLITPDQRRRLIRRYDAQGGWTSLTLVKEQRVG